MESLAVVHPTPFGAVEMGPDVPLCPHARLVHDYLSDSPVEMSRRHILDHALHYFVSGRGTYFLGGVTYAIRPGHLFLVRPGELFSIHTAPGRPVHMLNLHFDPVRVADSADVPWPYPTPEFPARTAPQLLLNFPGSNQWGIPAFCVAPDDYPARFGAVHRWFHFPDGRGVAARLRCVGAFQLLLSDLIVQERGQNAPPDAPLDTALEKALLLMRSHLDAPPSLEEIARHVGLSPSHFSLLFSSRLGLPPIKYQTILRLERARDELLLSARPIKEIAARVGYGSVAHFTRAFHQHFHNPPAAYRRAHLPPAHSQAED